jgi:hypothetical protein
MTLAELEKREWRGKKVVFSKKMISSIAPHAT